MLITILFTDLVDTCARVMGLAQGGQILLTRSAFDSARQMLKGEDVAGVGPLEWLNHGSYLLKGIEVSSEVREVGEIGIAPLQAPAGSEKAQRQATPETEPVLGWRPALGQFVPNTRWRLETKLGEGGSSGTVTSPGMRRARAGGDQGGAIPNEERMRVTLFDAASSS